MIWPRQLGLIGLVWLVLLPRTRGLARPALYQLASMVVELGEVATSKTLPLCALLPRRVYWRHMSLKFYVRSKTSTNTYSLPPTRMWTSCVRCMARDDTLRLVNK